MNTGCLKIFKKAAQFDQFGAFIPPHRRGDDIQLFRGENIQLRLRLILLSQDVFWWLSPTLATTPARMT